MKSFLDRTSFRSGILLCEQELAGIIRFPGESVKSEKLRRDENHTKRAPDFAACGNIVLGENTHQGITNLVSLPEETLTRHLLCLGATGSGKSNLLKYLAIQSIEQNSGCALFDVHGQLIEELIENILPHRIRDAIVFDPADDNGSFPVGFNSLSAHSETEKTLLASDLMAVFRRFRLPGAILWTRF